MRIQALELEPQAIVPALDEGRIDLAFGYLPELSITERRALLRQGHLLARRLRDRDALEQLDFILVRSHSEPAKALQLLALESRIRLTLPHCIVAPSILAVTDLAVVMPLRPAFCFAQRHALQVVEPVLQLPPFTVSVHRTWHVDHDPGHRWLREMAFAMRFAAVTRMPKKRRTG